MYFLHPLPPIPTPPIGQSIQVHLSPCIFLKHLESPSNPFDSCREHFSLGKKRSHTGHFLSNNAISGITRAEMKVTCLVWCPTFSPPPFNLMESIQRAWLAERKVSQ